MRFAGVIAIGSLLAMPQAAPAGYLTEIVENGSGNYETPFSVMDPLPQFNPKLGTLVSVAYAVSGVASVEAEISNTTKTTEYASINGGASFTVSGPGSTGNGLASYSVYASGQQVLLAGATSFVTETNSTNGFGGFSPFPSSELNLFIGTGTVSFTVASTGLPITVTGANSFSFPEDVGGVGIELEYTYLAVPEPSSFLLTISGAAFLGAVAIRRRRCWSS